MSRLHVHIATADFESSIAFYANLFRADPDVVSDNYANWRLSDPPANIELSANGAAPGINHLGIHAESESELARMGVDLASAARCCGDGAEGYWITDAQGVHWERVMDPALTGVFSEQRTIPNACCSPVASTGDSTKPCCVPGGATRAAQSAGRPGGCC